MPETILVVDDEKDILDMLRYNLQKEGYTVTTARNGVQAIEQIEDSPPDCIVLDIMMPEMDGLEVLKRLKQNPHISHVPVLFLTAKGAEIDEVVGLELGADDYIVKPISIRKLIARVKTALRRSDAREQKPPDAQDIVRIADLEINIPNYTLRIGGNEIAMPKKEFQTLVYLLNHRGRVISREALLNAVWGENVVVVDRTVDVHIRKIREKLGEYGTYIETVKGVGYRFKL